MKTIQIKIHKKTFDDRFGIQLAQQAIAGNNDGTTTTRSSSSTSRIFVEHMDSDSVFVNTDLKVGMELLEIDLQGLGGKSPIDAAKMLQDSPPGDILIVARDHSRRSYPKDYSMPTMRTIQISISKESPQDPLGLILTQNPSSSQILVKQVLPNGAVARSMMMSNNSSEQELVPGMQITEINLEGLAGKSVVDAVQMLRQATGEVMIVARGNFVSVHKTTNIQDGLGVVLQHKQTNNSGGGGASEMVIEKVSTDHGLFANSGLQPRQKISAINGMVLSHQQTNNNKDQVMELLQQAPVGQPITMVTLDSEVLQQEQEAPASAAAVVVVRPEQAPPRRIQRPSIVLNVDQEEEEEQAAPVAAGQQKGGRAPTVVAQEATAGYRKIQVTGSSSDGTAGTANAAGISLGMTQEHVYIHKIAPTSPFSGKLKQGQHVLKIQGMPCPLSLKKAMDMIAASSGSPLTLEVLEKTTTTTTMNAAGSVDKNLVAASASAAAGGVISQTPSYKEITAFITDKQVDEDLGITLALTQNYVYVHGMTAKSRFAETDLCVGHRIVKIDGEDCPTSLKDTLDLIAQHVGTLEINALEQVFSPNQVSASIFKNSIISPIGMDVAMSQQGRVVITRIHPKGRLASSSLRKGQVVWSINGMKCQHAAGTMRLLESWMRLLESSTGKVSIIASDIVAVATKTNIDQKAGITVAKRGDNKIVVYKIDKDGLFGNTTNYLTEGQEIISICGVKCPNNVKDAAGLIRDCVGRCTIVAMDTLPEFLVPQQ